MDDARLRSAPVGQGADLPFEASRAGLPPWEQPGEPTLALLTRPLPDAAGWTACLRDLDIPILAATAAALEASRANEDAVDANSLGELIATDPLMTLKLLAHAGTHRPARVLSGPDTVIGALVMMGISPFFHAFGPQPRVEDVLSSADNGAAVETSSVNGPDATGAGAHDNPSALAGLRRAIARARRAAHFALSFALHRADHHAAAVHQAALLFDFAELLLWCSAPLLALRIDELQRVDPTLRSDTVQRVVLNAELRDVQRSLVQTWQLPELLLRVDDERQAYHPSVRSVRLAVRLARPATQRFDDPAVADDVRDIGDLLGLSADATTAWLHEIDR